MTMSKFCHVCGNGAEISAKFCGNCGVGLIELQDQSVKESTHEAIDERIRLNLKGFTQHRNLTCLECGYVGLMGISRIEEGKEKKWLIWASGAFCFFASVFFGGFGFTSSVALGAIVGAYIFFDSSKRQKIFTVCPSCLLELKVNT